VQSGAFGEVLQQCVGRDPEDLAQRQELLVGTHCAFTLIVRGRHGNLLKSCEWWDGGYCSSVGAVRTTWQAVWA